MNKRTFARFATGPAVILLLLAPVLTTSSGCGKLRDRCKYEITTQSLPDGYVGGHYAFDLHWDEDNCYFGGDDENYYWSFVAGDLPPGLSFNSMGEFRGVPLVAGVYLMTIKLTYVSIDEYREVQKGFSLTVRE